MKKIYIIPELKEVKIQTTQHMLAFSDSATGVKFDDSAEAISNPGDMESRRSSFWDDDM